MMNKNQIIYPEKLKLNGEYDAIKYKLIKHLEGHDEISSKQTKHQKKHKDISDLIGNVKNFNDNQVVYYFDDDNQVLHYKTERIIPKKDDHRIPVMLLVSNPHPVSVSCGLPFSEGHSVDFWCSLFGSETLFPKTSNPDIKDYDCRKLRKDLCERQRIGNKLTAGDYNSDFLIYFNCYWEFPTKNYPKLEQIFNPPFTWGGMCLESKDKFCKIKNDYGINNIIVFADPPFSEITSVKNTDYAYNVWEDKVKRCLDKPDNGKELFKEDLDGPDENEGEFLYKMPIHCKYDSNVRVYRSLSTHIKDRYYTELLERIFKDISLHKKLRESSERGETCVSNNMWRKPNVEDDNLRSIWEYALSIDGYKYTKDYFNKDCGEIANAKLKNFYQNGMWDGSFEELRCCLFFEQRRSRNQIGQMSGKELTAIKMLYWTIVTKWYQETGSE